MALHALPFRLEMADPLAPSTQEALARRLRAGDPAALQALMEAFWPGLVRYARGILGSTDDAQDVAQEAFVRLWRDREARPPQAPVAPFLYRVARNLALNQRRALGVRTRWALLRRGAAAPRPATPAEESEATELSEAVAEALRRLPARRREVFELARLHGLSHQEIAEVMEISPQTVANQMSRALLDLRRDLGAFLGPD